MLKNYLMTTWRNLRSNPFIHSLNISGLAIGLAAFLFISLYAYHEHSYDQFHEDADRIFRVNHVIKQEGQDPYFGAATFARVAPALVEEFEQIEAACRVHETYNGAIGLVEDNPIEHENVFYTESSVFEIFSFPLIHGDRSTALDNINSAVLSEKVAQQHFGSTDCVGKQMIFLTLNGEQTFEITGVFDNSSPTHLEVDVFLSYSSLVQAWGNEARWDWRWFDFPTYVKVNPGTDLEALDKQFVSFIDKHGGEKRGSKVIDFDLIPVTDIHLQSNINQEVGVNGDGKMINLLMMIGVFILIIAWINYVNLYTAKANDRCREVGIRKALGSSKQNLVSQFLIEAGLTNFIAILIGFLGFQVIRILAIQYLGLHLPSIYEIGWLLPLLLLTVWLVSVLFSGTYPAVFISNFKTLVALKGDAQKSGGITFRKALVIFQFMASGFMIGGTIVVFTQFRFMQNQPTGVDTSDTIVLEMRDFSGNGQYYTSRHRVLTTEIHKINGVRDVAVSSDVPGAEVDWRGTSWLVNKPEDRKIVYKMTVNNNYLEFLDADFLSGSNFFDDGDSLSVIINQEALHLYGFESPEEAINQRIGFAGLDTMRVVGVIANFYQESLKEAFKPTVYLRIDSEIKYMSVRVNHSNLSSFLQTAEAKFKEFFPTVPFTYSFMDNLMEIRHQKERAFQLLFNVFAALAIFLSFLGLLGLAFYTTSKRRKEAGIRKVLGSSTGSIVQLVFKDFAKLVLLGNLLAIPVLWKLADQWLNQFAFHVSFSWLIPFATILVSILFAFTFTFFHLIKLGNVNPVEVLKDE